MAKHNPNTRTSQNQKPPSVAPKKLDRDDVVNKITAAIQAKIDSAGSDFVLDQVNQKRFLAEFKVYNPRVALYVGDIQRYLPRIPLEYYQHICRLNGWPASHERKRPGIVGHWTNWIVYERYGKIIFNTIKERNIRTVSGDLLYKQHQQLTPLGVADFDKFIQEAIELMRRCSIWSQFESLYKRTYARTWQSSLFENNQD